MTGHDNQSKFQCVCCLPARQVYRRYQGVFDAWYHEDDHSEAKPREEVQSR